MKIFIFITIICVFSHHAISAMLKFDSALPIFDAEILAELGVTEQEAFFEYVPEVEKQTISSPNNSDTYIATFLNDLNPELYKNIVQNYCSPYHDKEGFDEDGTPNRYNTAITELSTTMSEPLQYLNFLIAEEFIGQKQYIYLSQLLGYSCVCKQFRPTCLYHATLSLVDGETGHIGLGPIGSATYNSFAEYLEQNLTFAQIFPCEHHQYTHQAYERFKQRINAVIASLSDADVSQEGILTRHTS